MATYIAFLHKEDESDFGVSFPDFPGCVTAGKTLDEARTLASEALGLHVSGMVEDGEVIPAPSSLDEVMAFPEASDAVVLVVDVQEKAPKTVRVNVTFAEDVLEKIDHFAESQGTTRSGFLARAAVEAMKATPGTAKRTVATKRGPKKVTLRTAATPGPKTKSTKAGR